MINIGEHGYLHEAGRIGKRNKFHGPGSGWMNSVGYNHTCHFKFLMEIPFRMMQQLGCRRVMQPVQPWCIVIHRMAAYRKPKQFLLPARLQGFPGIGSVIPGGGHVR